MTNTRSALLWIGAVVLVANVAYLAVAAEPTLFHLIQLLLHPVLALVLLVPFALWARRLEGAAVRWGAGLVLVAAVAGVGVVVVGSAGPRTFLLWGHAGLAVAGLALLVWAVPGGWGWRRAVSAAGLAVAVLVVIAGRYGARAEPDQPTYSNPPAPTSLADEAVGGAEGPFYPSSLATPDARPLPAEGFSGAASCGGSGCHAEIVEQWRASPHHHSGLGNPWYRSSFEHLRGSEGEVASRWCAGCHTPALLAAGRFGGPTAEMAADSLSETGVDCAVCHVVARVRGSMGQAGLELETGALHRLATSPDPWRRALHALLVRLDPEPHRRTYARPLHAREVSAELCSSCHKAHADKPLNHYRWVSVMNDYDPWQSYSVSGQGHVVAIHFPEPRTCVDCHMPSTPDGPSSHRFAAANSALPAWRGDAEQLAAVEEFLTSGIVTVDLFAMGARRPLGDSGDRDGARDTSLYAPLDRLPMTLRRGESIRVDLLLRTRGVGHMFPGGKDVSKDCWIELEAIDETGRTIFHNGWLGADGEVDPDAHFIRGLWVDGESRRVENYEFWRNHVAAYVQQIEPEASFVVRYRLDVPPGTGDELTIRARVRYRKFRPRFTRRAFAELGLGPADLPVVTLAETSLALPVVDAGAELPEMGEPREVPEIDFERWYDFAYGLANRGDIVLARRAFDRALALGPERPQLWATLGNLEWLLGENDSARVRLERALELDPDLARAHYFLGLLAREAGEMAAAIEHLSLAEQSFPRDPNILSALGQTHLMAGDPATTRTTLEALLEINPESAQAHFMLANAHRALGDQAAAAHHQALYERFRFDVASQELVAAYLSTDPEANAERQTLHEHVSTIGEER